MSKEFDEFMDGVKNIDLNKMVCMFEPTTDTSSATICKHCGKEKFLHNQVPDVGKMVEDDVVKLAEEYAIKVYHAFEDATWFRPLNLGYYAGYTKAKEMYKAETEITENTSDGYHTFKELYEFRKAYNVALFNEWGKFDIPYYDVHKSWKHNDDEQCFGGGWFIVVAVLPTGQISNHYPASDWDLFKIPEVEKAKYPFDGHTGQDVINRLLSICETFKQPK